MDEAFWQQRWRDNKIAFHEEQGNALLRAHFHRLSLQAGARVFVPLCGKAHDLAWIAAQGCRVVGIELNRSAVEAVFAALGADPEVESLGDLTRYSTGTLELFVGDFFDLSRERLGPVDAIYDRGALVALPAAMRTSYARHLTALTKTASQLLISYEYDQTQTEGPPFSVSDAEISELYADRYKQEHIAGAAISGPLAERCSGTENAWLLSPI